MDFPSIYFWAPPSQNPTRLFTVFTGSAQIVPSVEDGKTLIKIEKVSVKASHFPMAYLFAFTLLVGILSSSTLFGQNQSNKNASSRKVREREVETLVDQHKVDWLTVILSYLISSNPLLLKNMAYVGSFQQFVFVFVFKCTKDMSQMALQPI